MNVLVLGSRVIGIATAHECVKSFLSATFSGEDHHARRLAKVKKIESRFAVAPAKA